MSEWVIHVSRKGDYTTRAVLGPVAGPGLAGEPSSASSPPLHPQLPSTRLCLTARPVSENPISGVHSFLHLVGLGLPKRQKLLC